MSSRSCLLWAGGALLAVVLLASSCGVGILIGAATRDGARDGGPFGGDRGAVAVIRLAGQITSDESGGDFFGSAGASSGRLIQDLRRAQKDPGVKAILLRIDSPGGSAAASEAIYREILRTRQDHHKPVVAVMETLAASGGYYVAVGTDRIVANPNTLTGSIGVITILPNIQELLQKIGVAPQVFKSGGAKDGSTGFRPLTQEEVQVWQSLVEDTFQRFVEVVANGRNMSQDRVRQLADGRLYSARQALSLGLIDELGDVEDALLLTGRIAGIEGRPRVVEYRRAGLLSEIFSTSSRPSLEGELRRALSLDRTIELQYLYVGPQ